MDFGGMLFSRASKQKEQHWTIAKVQDSYQKYSSLALRAVQEFFVWEAGCVWLLTLPMQQEIAP